MNELVELQKALDNRPKPTDIEFAVQIDAITFHKGINKTAWEKAENEWYEDLTAKFAVFQRGYKADMKLLRELEETCKILSDEKLMKAIRKERKQGSKSSPYKPLEEV